MNPDQFETNEVESRSVYAAALEHGDWNKALEVLAPHIESKSKTEWVNLPHLNRSGGESRSNVRPNGYSALHYAATHGAPITIVEAFIELGGFSKPTLVIQKRNNLNRHLRNIQSN